MNGIGIFVFCFEGFEEWVGGFKKCHLATVRISGGWVAEVKGDIGLIGTLLVSIFINSLEITFLYQSKNQTYIKVPNTRRQTRILK